MDDDTAVPVDRWPQCDCGYCGQGETKNQRVHDAQRHAREAHGIDVTADQILKEGPAS